jgi:hypothetical protein
MENSISCLRSAHDLNKVEHFGEIDPRLPLGEMF